MARRNITKRADGRYQSQVYIGSENGKKIVKTVYGRTIKELEEKERNIKVKLGRGFDVMAERKTFGDWAELLLEQKKPMVSAGRYNNYKLALEKFRPIYKMRLEKIYSIDIQRIINQWAEKNENTGEPSSKDTLVEMKRAANMVFKLAISNRVVEFNPVTDVKVVALKKKVPRRALTEQEQNWVRNTEHRAQTAAMIMMYCGLRRGELIPLRWSDVDFKENTISVTKSVEVKNNRFVEKGGAKSDCSVRKIPMPDILADHLLEEKKKAASIFVVPTIKGQMMSETAWRRMWQSYMTDLNFLYGDFSMYGGKKKSKYDPEGVPMVIEEFTPHYLRHTYASILFMAGVDVVTAKELMGHADIETTLEVYTHLSKTHKKKEITKLNDFLAAAK